MTDIIKLLAILFFALGVAGVPAHSQTTTPETLTLDRVIAEALRANTSVKNADLEIEKIGFAQSAYRTRRLPAIKLSALVGQPLTRMNFTVEKGQFGTYSGTGPIPDVDTRIRSSMSASALVTAQIQQPLSQLYAITLNIKKFDLNKEMAQEQTRQKRQEVLAEVKAAYFQIMQSESLLKSAAEFVTLNREINRVTEQFVQRGVALIPEQMETGTRVSQAEYEVTTLKNRSDSQKEQLNFLLGRDVRTDFNVTSPDSIPTITATDLAGAQKRALDQRPEIRQAQLKIKQANLDVKIKKSDWIPEVSLTATYASPFTTSTYLPKNSVTVGVSVEWEVFDWGRKKRELAEKRVSVEQSENSLREAENIVLMEVNAKFRKLSEAAEELRIKQLTQKTAHANVRVALSKYEQQTALYKDVLQVQTTLTDANTKYQVALLSFWTAKAEFEKALGEEK